MFFFECGLLIYIAKPKFYKTTYHVEMLTDRPLREALDLDAINYMITEGEASGVVTDMGTVTLTGRQAAKALIDQGSDPSFFNLDEDGNELD